MAKLVLNDLINLENAASAVAALNNVFTAIETAMEKTLSRDGTSPNMMNADLDMNSQQILNLPAAIIDTDPIRKVEFDSAIFDINIIVNNAVLAAEAAAISSAASAASAASATNFSTFKTISVAGQADVIADNLVDTLTLVAGPGITLTTNAATDTITLTASGVVVEASPSLDFSLADNSQYIGQVV